jgi:hypothetical protein
MHKGYNDENAERAQKAVIDQSKAFQKTPSPTNPPASSRHAPAEDNDAIRQYAIITGSNGSPFRR